MHTLAIDIGGTKFSMAVFDEAAKMIARASQPTDREGGRAWMMERIAANIREWQSCYRLTRGGIGFGGPVHFDRQCVAKSTHVGGWSEFDLPGALSGVLGFRPALDNDANVGALGEGLFGAGQGARPLFYMTLSTGIGGGIVLDEENTVLRGPDSYAGEIGHVNILPEGPPCLCGSNGCLERMCCGLWLERDYGKPAHELLADPAFTARYVVNLARGLKVCIMLLNPERIVIGGGISKAGDALFAPLREELSRQIPAWSHARIDVVPAALGDDSVLYGAYALAGSITADR